MGLFRKRQQETTKWKLPTIDIFGKSSHQQPEPEDKRLTDEITQLFAKYGCEAELEEVNSGPRAIQFKFKKNTRRNCRRFKEIRTSNRSRLRYSTCTSNYG